MNIVDTECCGLFQLVNLPDWIDEISIRRAIKAFGPPRGGARLQAVTRRNEKNLRRTLKALGFKPTKPWRNGNTGNVLTLWILDLGQPRAAKKKK